MLLFFLSFVAFVIVLGVFLVFKYTRKKKLSDAKKKIFLKNFHRIKILSSSKEKIIDFDKLYHQLLKWIWYEGTFWEILKLEAKEISNLNKIWELHKLRNKLVHDFDLLEENILKKRALEYEKEIKRLLNII